MFYVCVRQIRLNEIVCAILSVLRSMNINTSQTNQSEETKRSPSPGNQVRGHFLHNEGRGDCPDEANA